MVWGFQLPLPNGTLLYLEVPRPAPVGRAEADDGGRARVLGDPAVVHDGRLQQRACAATRRRGLKPPRRGRGRGEGGGGRREKGEGSERREEGAGSGEGAGHRARRRRTRRRRCPAAGSGSRRRTCRTAPAAPSRGRPPAAAARAPRRRRRRPPAARSSRSCSPAGATALPPPPGRCGRALLQHTQCVRARPLRARAAAWGAAGGRPAPAGFCVTFPKSWSSARGPYLSRIITRGITRGLVMR
jgi:hypothetical protein